MKVWMIVLVSLIMAAGLQSQFNFPVRTVEAKAGLPNTSPSPQAENQFQAQPPTASVRPCQLIETRIAANLQNFGQHRLTQIQHYAQVKTSLSELISYLEGEGYDLTELKTSFSQFEAQLQTMAAVMETHYQELDQTRKYACGDSDGQFVEQLQKARQSRAEVRDLAKDIKRFYQTEIRPKVIELKTGSRRKTE